MALGRERRTMRVTTLVTMRDKAELAAKARQAGVSVGEFVRRAIEAFDPDELKAREELSVFMRALNARHTRTSTAQH